MRPGALDREVSNIERLVSGPPDGGEGPTNPPETVELTTGEVDYAAGAVSTDPFVIFSLVASRLRRSCPDATRFQSQEVTSLVWTVRLIQRDMAHHGSNSRPESRSSLGSGQDQQGAVLASLDVDDHGRL